MMVRRVGAFRVASHAVGALEHDTSWRIISTTTGILTQPVTHAHAVVICMVSSHGVPVVISMYGDTIAECGGLSLTSTKPARLLIPHILDRAR